MPAKPHTASHQLLLHLEIHCIALPSSHFEGRQGLRLGIQRSREVVDDVPADVTEVRFPAEFRVVQRADGGPNFLGPYAHGTPQQRFVYLCWGTRGQDGWEGLRRAKISLHHLDWSALATAQQHGQPLRARVTMTDPQGEPLCASVKPQQILWTIPPLRPATVADATAMHACVTAAYEGYIPRLGKPPGPMLDDYTQVVQEHQSFVVELAGRVVAVLVLIHQEEGLLLDNIAVDPAHQGSGLGKRLMAFAETEARRQGYPRIRLYTHERMHENLVIYQRLGYQEIARREERGYRRVYLEKLLN